MTHEIIIGCDGSGKKTGSKQIDWPIYENGTAAFDWHPPDTLSDVKRDRIAARLEKHRKQQIKIMDLAARGLELDDDLLYPPGT